MTELSSEEIDRRIAHYMDLLETDLGEDIIPTTIILLCRVVMKYNLNIDWVLRTIEMGYRNEVPPTPIVASNDIVKFDS